MSESDDSTEERRRQQQQQEQQEEQENVKQEDLDLFLTSIESRLRGPFSSLDLAKALTTTALRGNLTPVQYIQRIRMVFRRTDKVIQLRILIGLLGLEPSPGINREVFRLLAQAQEAPTYEEWVRAIAGLIQGIMFQDSNGERCRGEEAQQLLDKTCEEIIQTVQTILEQNDDKNDQSNPPDMNASFCPFRYSLIPQPILKPIIPELCGTNPHFQVDETANVLLIDEQLEAQRVKEEQEHQAPISASKGKHSNPAGSSAAAASSDIPAALPPGFRPTKLVPTTNSKSTAGAKPKSNMFMPTKPIAGRGTLSTAQKGSLAGKRGTPVQKTLLRRKGGAQSLVKNSSLKSRLLAKTSGSGAASGLSVAGKGRMGATAAAASSLTPTAASRNKGRAGMAASRSKMKMIDVTEVDSLNKEHAKRDESLALSRMSKKRRIMEAAKANSITSTPLAKKSRHDDGGADETNAAPTMVDATTTSADNPLPAQPEEAPKPSNGGQSTAGDNEEWKSMLQERSNKLSDEDRVRVQQFFQNRYNPTPDQPVYKMKLHEQRINDPKTGQAIKETYYLELDYQTFLSKQSKKIKRYD